MTSPVAISRQSQRCESGAASRNSHRWCPEDVGHPASPRRPVRSVTAMESPSRSVSIEPPKHTPVTPALPEVDIEEDLETVLDTSERMTSYDETGALTYERACRKLGIIPSSRCIKSLLRAKEILDLKFYGLGAKGTTAVSMALVINDRVSMLNMRGNDIGPSGMMYIQRMMHDNCNIVELNVSENHLGTEGARNLGQLLKMNRVIKYLDASGNNFLDLDAALITKPVEHHSDLLKLNLSHNSFGNGSADAFQQMIAENGSLQELDLSWNHFRGQGAKKICNGLAENVSIKVFNASWNGFDDDGAAAMASALKNNSVLVEVDVQCNRMGQIGFMELISALKANDTLEILRVGKNNINEECAKAAVELLKRTDNVKLLKLDLSDVILSPRFANCLSDLYDFHPELEVVYGYTDSYGKRKMKGYDIVEEAMGVIAEYLIEKDITIVELFSRFDADGSMSVTHEEFREGLKDAGIPLTDAQVEEVIKGLDMDGDGEIDFSELVISTKDVF